MENMVAPLLTSENVREGSSSVHKVDDHMAKASLLAQFAIVPWDPSSGGMELDEATIFSGNDGNSVWFSTKMKRRVRNQDGPVALSNPRLSQAYPIHVPEVTKSQPHLRRSSYLYLTEPNVDW